MNKTTLLKWAARKRVAYFCFFKKHLGLSDENQALNNEIMRSQDDNFY